jgi:CRP-like cAMP-binding protein
MDVSSDAPPGALAQSPLSATRQFFELFGGGPLPDWEGMDEATESISVAAAETIFERGIEHPFVYVILDGSVKLLAVDERGNEHLVGVARAGELVASVGALAPQGLATYVDKDLLGGAWTAANGLGTTDVRAVAIRPCSLERVDFRVVHEKMRVHGGTWAVAVFNAALHYALVEEHRARQFLMLTAEDRYRHFLTRYPDLVGVLPQKDIGNYVGVTPVGISRIAARVRDDEHRNSVGRTSS